MIRLVKRFFALKLPEPTFHSYDPKLLNLKYTSPFNESLKAYQAKVMERLEEIKLEVASFPPHKLSTPQQSEQEGKDKQKGEEEREWKQIKEIYQQNTTKRKFREKEERTIEQQALAKQARELELERGLIFKRTFLEALSKKQFIDWKDWEFEIERALDNPISFDSSPEQLIAARNRQYSKITERIDQSLNKVARDNELI